MNEDGFRPEFVIEPMRETPVSGHYDVCVLGGSCTGAFAAIRAARLGARVALIEKSNCLGGVAATGGVCVWHTLLDHELEKQIIAGLTQELIERLEMRRAVDIKEAGPHRGRLKRIFRKSTIDVGRADPSRPLQYRMDNILAYLLNTEELKIELDEMVLESGADLYLHTYYADPFVVEGRLSGVFIQNKDGRTLIRARQFVDATGEGRICVDLGLEYSESQHPQPATTLAKIYGVGDVDVDGLVEEHGAAHRLADGGWSSYMPGMKEVLLVAKTRVFKNCAYARELTDAEVEGRRQIRAIMDLVRGHGSTATVQLLSLSSRIGIRETRRIRCRYRLTQDDVLGGRRFEDGIANMAYPVDVHHGDGSGVTQMYLDGYQERIRHGSREVSRWKPEDPKYSTYYQIPLRCLTPQGPYANLLVCGRSIDTDDAAFASSRVMISANQQGEAAGVAAALAAAAGCDLDTTGRSDAAVSAARVRDVLERGGSIVR